MRKIDQKYLKRAKDINAEFVQLSSKLKDEEDRLTKVKNSLQKIVEDLKKTNQKLTQSRDKNDAQPIYGILDDLSIQYQKIENVLKPIIGDIDKLRKEELVLFETIQRTYPELKPEEIKEQVHDFVFG
jgi:hypothetical protein